MKVKKLIAELKKMPQNLEVYTSAHDHSDWECAGIAGNVMHHKKADFVIKDLELNDFDLERFNATPKEWITIST